MSMQGKVRRLPYTEQQIQDIISDYQSGMDYQKILAKHNVSDNTMKYIRKKYKIPVRTAAGHRFVEQAVQEHINGTSLKDVCQKYNTNSTAVYRYMKEHGIEYKNGHGRKYHCDESFFHVIDTEAKAYWLGFIYGDGCVAYSDKSCTSPNRLSINLSSKDRCQLEDFNRDISSSFPVTDYIPKGTYAENPMSKLYINSIEMCRDLISHGCVPNKTRQLSFPYSSIPDHLYRHFIRGLFDADGCIAKGPVLVITKYIPFLLQIQDILESERIVSNGKIYTYKDRAEGIGDLKYFGKDNVFSLALYLYRDATVFLERKCQKAYSILTE